MAAQSRVEGIGLIVAFASATMLLSAWAYNGFAISKGDYQNRPSISLKTDKLGCYINGDLRVIVENRGLIIPDSGIVFKTATIARDKQGEFIFFEPAINIESAGVGKWRVYEDIASKMIQKFYFSGPKGSEGIVIPWISKNGINLSRTNTTCL